MSAGPYYLLFMRHPGLRLTYGTTEITTEQFTERITTVKVLNTTKKKNAEANVQRIYTKITNRTSSQYLYV